MSLLIKALAAAEKDKQTELKKKQTVDSATDVAVTLELAPVEPRVEDATVPADAVVNMVSVSETKSLEATNTAEKSELDLAADLLHDDGLSLAEEAGLTLPKEPVSKYVKPKSGVNKAASKAEEAAPKVRSTSSGDLKSRPVSTSASSQKVAASAFVANQAVKNSSSKSALFLLGVAGALMIWLGLQGYQYIKDLTAPVAVIIKPTPPAVVANSTAPATPHQAEPIAVVANQDVAMTAAEVSQKNKQETFKVTKAVNSAKAALNDSDDASALEVEVAKKPVPKPLKNSGTAMDSGTQSLPQNAAQHEPLKLISKTPAVGIDPALLAAYQAFSRGENAVAQQQYRDVLQRDVRNVDALLGMAAIAQRQGRDADAAGWYQKVLEIEPKNIIAQSALTSVQTDGEIADSDLVAKESHLKNMLAQQPDAANLHAALGNLFAAQNQWPAAQEAYFNASRFAPNNADYAFNLAISLDQLGKARLALTQYQRALDLLDGSGASSPDRTQLEARIKALQTLK